MALRERVASEITTTFASAYTREVSLALPPADPAPPHKLFESWFAHLEALLAVLRSLPPEQRGKTLVYNCGLGGPMFNGLGARCYVKDDSPVAPLHAEVSRLNELAQKQRMAAGHVTGDPIPVGEERLHVNDRVLFTRNSLALSVFNGELGTVTAREGTRLTVAMDQGRTVTVDTLAYSHLRLGYALTTHKAQGMTTEQTYVLTGPLQNRELTYVQASRARGDTRFFVGSEGLQRTADRMARSQPKELASDLADDGPVLELVPNR